MLPRARECDVKATGFESDDETFTINRSQTGLSFHLDKPLPFERSSTISMEKFWRGSTLTTPGAT